MLLPKARVIACLGQRRKKRTFYLKKILFAVDAILSALKRCLLTTFRSPETAHIIFKDITHHKSFACFKVVGNPLLFIFISNVEKQAFNTSQSPKADKQCTNYYKQIRDITAVTNRL